jgi:dihydroorotase
MYFDLFISNADVFFENKLQKLNIGILNGQIKYLGSEKLASKEHLDLSTCWVLPGLIDSQVHFREPGLTHKEDLETGTRSALLGGITAILEMPNTNPTTSTEEKLNEKLSLARNRCHVDYGFFIGATHENVNELAQLEKLPGCCGIKIFMGSSTGSLLLDDDQDLEVVFATTNGPLSVHCEDEKRLVERKKIALESANVTSHPDWRDEESGFIATEKVVRLSKKYNRSVHVLHISSQKEIEFLAQEKNQKITVEVLPQHLYFSAPDCYQKYGTRVQMNPPIRERNHTLALNKALRVGVVDVIGSDHAPHTLEEKAKNYPLTPSGMPGVQTIVNVMLDKVLNKEISLLRMVELLCFNPIKIFEIKNRGPLKLDQPAYFTIVDPHQESLLLDQDMASRSGWTPYHNLKFKGKVISTVLNGVVAMREGKVLSSAKGRALTYKR